MKPGLRLGRYELVRRIGRGGMGDVWEAVLHGPQGFRKPVALKLLAAPDDLRHRRGLVKEARLGAMLSHPNVVATHDLGLLDDERTLYLAMELVHGASLADLAQTGSLPVGAALEVGVQVCTALAHVHAAGLVHRDVKPANLLLDRSGLVKLADLGVARLAADPDVPSGTPSYMPPEQRLGTEDARADLYALGVTLLRLTTATKEPDRDTLDGLLPGFAEVVDRCLEPEPRDRWTDADSLRAALLHLRAAAPSGPSLLGLLGALRPDLQGHPAVPASRPSDEETLRLPGAGLPAWPDPVVGRVAEIARVCAAIAEGSRLVALIGAGGMGKTRLAVEVARHELGRWTGGVFFCPLVEARTSDDVATSVARVLGLSLRTTDPAQRVARALSNRGRVLLVLDNLEQVVDAAAPLVASWVARCPELTVLATSRVALGCRGEHRIGVEPLTSTEATALFEARSQRPLDGDERDVLPELVDALDRMPLALELAAARCQVLSVVQIRERLRDRFRLLASAGADRPARHRSLRASLHGSWELLTPHEQVALGQLSVFADGCTLEGADAIVSLSAFPDAPWTLDVLDRLVAHSLLTYSRRDDRFRMLQAVREFAAEQAPAPRARDRHARWYAKMGDPRGHEARREQRSTVDELADVEAALDHEVTSGRAPLAAPLLLAFEAVARRAVPLGRIVGHATAVLALAELEPSDTATAHLVRGRARMHAGEMVGAEADFESTLAIADADGRIRSRAHAGLGLLLRNRGENARGRGHQEEAVEQAHRAGALALESAMRANLANHLQQTGQIAMAQAQIDGALELARAAGSAHREAHALSVRAAIVRDTDPEEAIAGYAFALQVAIDRGDRRDEGHMQSNLASVHQSLGRGDVARRYLHAALTCAREIGDPTMEATVLGNLGLALQDQDPSRAREALERALALNREVDDRRGVAHVLGNLGLSVFRAGDSAEALAILREGAEASRAVGDRRGEAIQLGNIGMVQRSLGDAKAAVETQLESLALHRELGNRRSEGISLNNLGWSLEALGRVEEARERYEQALAIHREIGNERSEGIALTWLGKLDEDAGDLGTAEQRWRDALTIQRRVRNRLFLGQTLCHLATLLAATDRIEEARALIHEAAEHIDEESLPSQRELLSEARRVLGDIGRID